MTAPDNDTRFVAARAYLYDQTGLDALPPALEALVPEVADTLFRREKSVKTGDVTVEFAPPGTISPALTRQIARYARMRW